MIIQNVPPSFVSHIENSYCAFSDDLRFIYLSRPNLVLLIYDNKYNKYITLKADAAIIEYLKQLEGFKGLKLYSNMAFIQVVNQNTLIIFYGNQSFNFLDDGYSALIILVQINFPDKTFSMIDKMTYSHCYYPYLLKDGSQYALLHNSSFDEPMDEGNACRCFLLEINENGIHQTSEDPLIFDYDYLSLSHRPVNLHFNDNKIWYFRDTTRWQNRSVGEQNRESKFLEQLSYFDLNESSPIKETTVELLNDDGKSYYSGSFLIYFQNQYEYEMLNLHTKSWTNGRNNLELQKYKIDDSNLICFVTERSKQGSYNIDKNFNVIAIDKITKQLFLVPLKNPQSLYDIAWTTALNAGSFEQQDTSQLPKNLKYQKLF